MNNYKDSAAHVYVLGLTYGTKKVLKIGFSRNVFRRIRVFKNLGIKTKILHISIANSSNSINQLERLLLKETVVHKTSFPIKFSGDTEIRSVKAIQKIKEIIDGYNEETLISIL